MACDFFSVDTIALRRLHLAFFIHHSTRRVFLAGIMTSPTWEWVTQCARNVSEDLRKRRPLGQVPPARPGREVRPEFRRRVPGRGSKRRADSRACAQR